MRQLAISNVGESKLFMAVIDHHRKPCYYLRTQTAIYFFLFFVFEVVDQNCHSTYTYDKAQELKLL